MAASSSPGYSFGVNYFGNATFRQNLRANKTVALVDLTPTVSAAHKAWKEVCSESVNARGISDEADSHYGFDVPLVDEEKSRMRFAHSGIILSTFKQFGPRWGRGMSLAYLAAPVRVRRVIINTFKELGLWEIKTAVGLQSTLKALGSAAKRWGDRLFPGSWKWFVNWENLGGYMRADVDVNFEDEIRGWLTGDIIHTFADGDESRWLDVFEQGAEDFLADLPNLRRT